MIFEKERSGKNYGQRPLVNESYRVTKKGMYNAVLVKGGSEGV